MLDPWLFALHKHIIDNNYRIEKPLLCINSSEYHENVPGFFSFETLSILFQNCNGEQDRNYVMKETAHLFQTDILSLAPLEFKMWTQRNPTNDVVELYELANKLMMNWLKRFGFEKEIKTKPHTQIDEYYEPRLIKCVNRPEENEPLDEEEKKKEEEEKKE